MTFPPVRVVERHEIVVSSRGWLIYTSMAGNSQPYDVGRFVVCCQGGSACDAVVEGKNADDSKCSVGYPDVYGDPE